MARQCVDCRDVPNEVGCDLTIFSDSRLTGS